MSDKPIIFSAPMIRALLEGRKTQTRRVLKPKGVAMQRGYANLRLDVLDGALWWWDGVHDRVGASQPYPYAPGDRLWAREAHTFQGQSEGECLYRATVGDDTDYYAEEIAGLRWRPSIHMPRWASRLTLIVTDVRVQRLQDISAPDAVAEGCWFKRWITGEYPFFDQGVDADNIQLVRMFRDLWNSLHGPDAWDANPWVVALTFTVHRCNIDQTEARRE